MLSLLTNPPHKNPFPIQASSDMPHNVTVIKNESPHKTQDVHNASPNGLLASLSPEKIPSDLGDGIVTIELSNFPTHPS